MWFALWCIGALAQDPEPVAEPEPAAEVEAPSEDPSEPTDDAVTPSEVASAVTEALSAGLETGQVRYVVEDVKAQRFPDTPEPTFDLAKDDQVDVLFGEPDRVRIKKGAQYGWVPRTALTDLAPAATAAPALDLLSNPSLTAPIQLDRPSLSEGFGAGAGSEP